MKFLVIVDMQKDFLTGSLANPDAVAIVPGICDYIKNFDGKIVCTYDTHTVNYLLSTEGHYLPVEHCIKGTDGWNLDATIYDTLRKRQVSLLKAAEKDETSGESRFMKMFKAEPFFLEKPTFGFMGWKELHLDSPSAGDPVDEIIMVGTCTDICVVSNALILKATYPNIKITVLKDLCAGLSKEKHEAALETMRSCQIEVE